MNGDCKFNVNNNVYIHVTAEWTSCITPTGPYSSRGDPSSQCRSWWTSTGPGPGSTKTSPTLTLNSTATRVPWRRPLATSKSPGRCSRVPSRSPNDRCGMRKSARHSTLQLFHTCVRTIPPDHLSLDNAPNLGPLISRWEINKFENCWYKSVRILEVLMLLFHQILNSSSSQQIMSGPILGHLSNNRSSGVHGKYASSVLVSGS